MAQHPSFYRKHFLSSRFSCKADARGAGAFYGYASVFFVRDSQGDIVLPGAFRQSLLDGARTVPLLWQHRPDAPIGIVADLKEDDVGLYIAGQLNMDVAQAREAYALLASGAPDGLSIGYEVEESRFDPDTGARLLMSVKLWEISLVTFPANDEARVTAVKHSDMAHEGSDMLTAGEEKRVAEALGRLCAVMEAGAR